MDHRRILLIASLVAACLVFWTAGASATAGNPSDLPCFIRGKVISDDGKPLPGAVVSARNMKAELVAEATTGEEGHYSFFLIEGNYTVQAAMPGYVAATRSIELPGKESRDQGLTFRLAAAADGATSSSIVYRSGPGWYFGDAHMHTAYSDGKASVAEMVASATSKGLDFIIITDHNTVAHRADVEKIDVPGFLCLFGEEVTSKNVGHCNAYFINRVINWKTDSNQQLIDWAHEDGGLIFANHPHYPNLEWKDWDVRNLDGIEVWNGHYPPRHEVNAQAFADWDRELNEGNRVVGLANSDAHNPGRIGNPRMGFYLYEFSPKGIRDAMEDGNIYGTNGPRVDFTIDVRKVGWTVETAPDDPLSLDIATESENPIRKIILIRNGDIVKTWEGEAEVYDHLTVTKDCWYRVEVEDSAGGFAFTNPIWVDVE